MVPIWTGKPGKMGTHFLVGEKLGNFTQNTGKLGEFHPKYWKSEGILASFFILNFFGFFN